MITAKQVREIRKKYRSLLAVLDERQRRLWAAAETRPLGRGGLAAVVRATGMAKTTVARGLRDLELGRALASDRVRRPGGGRKRVTVVDPSLVAAMKHLVEPVTRGDPESPLLWTCKSTRRLAAELEAQGHPISHTAVADLLWEQGYSLQSNRKTKEGASHPDRNAHIVNLIGATTTSTGLRVLCMLDRRTYPKSVVVSDEQMATINLVPDRFHGHWNYTIKPCIR